MLHREDHLRRSEEYQQKFEEAERTARSDWMEVAQCIQERVCGEFGFRGTQLPTTLAQMRSAALRHPEIAHYVRFNRCRRGGLRVGDACPDVTVHGLDGSIVKLREQERDGRPLCIIAGSYS